MNKLKLNGMEYLIGNPYKLKETEKEEIEVELNRKWDLFYWYSYSEKEVKKHGED